MDHDHCVWHRIPSPAGGSERGAAEFPEVDIDM